MSDFTTESQGHRETDEPRNLRTSPIIGAAIEIHRHLGPGLLESLVFSASLCPGGESFS